VRIPSPGTTAKPSYRSGRFSKFSSTGALVWTKWINDPTLFAFPQPANLALGCDGLYATGWMHSGSQFPGGVAPPSNNTHDQFYVARLSTASGNADWVRTGYSNAVADHVFGGNSIIIGNYGRIHIVGSFRGQISFDGGATFSNSSENPDAFLVSYGSDGTLLGSQVFAGQLQQKAFGVAADRSGGVYVTGSFQHNITVASYGNTTGLMMTIYL
jgi:hypothetical protein